MRVVNGMHLPNQGMWHIEDMLNGVIGPKGALTILHFLMFPKDNMSDNTGDVENNYWYGKIRHGWPDQGISPGPERLIHIRLYQAKWKDWDPVVLAQRAVSLLSNWTGHGAPPANLWDDPLVCVSPCNEQNLEGEWGDWWGLTTAQRTQILEHEAVWQLRFWDEVDRLIPNRKAPSVLGALAFGGDWLPDVPDSEYQHPRWKELCQRVDILATHPYANFTWPGGGGETADVTRDGYWHLYRDFRPAGWRDSRQPGKPHDVGGILAQCPNKPLLITETGTFVHGDAGRNAETMQALTTLYSMAVVSGRVLGITPFIWNSGPEHAGNRIWYNAGLRTWFCNMPRFDTKAVVPKKGAQPPLPPVPTPDPVPGDWPRPMVSVDVGDKSWYQILRKMGVPATNFNVQKLRAANRASTSLKVGMWLESPFHKVAPK